MEVKSIAKIIKEDELVKFIQMDEYLTFINQAPPRQFVKEHPMQKGVRYIPIEKIELMLTKIFQEWRVMITGSGQLLNSVFVQVRLGYKHPINGKWTYQDGIGAVAIQVDKGHNASELGFIKSNAIMLALPSAKSYAIKDAAEHIGKLFGRDLNRKDTIAFTPTYGTAENIETVEDKKKAIKEKLENEDN
jgi:hypothetical protein